LIRDYRWGGKEKAMEAKARLAAGQAKEEAEQIISGASEVAKDAKDKVTK
jgi:uncharacterized protein YjbJ (UPF0337 family)